jgi:hypothetical protein
LIKIRPTVLELPDYTAFILSMCSLHDVHKMNAYAYRADCVCLHLSTRTDFDAICYERYATSGHPNLVLLNFLQSVITSRTHKLLSYEHSSPKLLSFEKSGHICTMYDLELSRRQCIIKSSLQNPEDEDRDGPRNVGVFIF